MDELVELLWDSGTVVVQGQSSRPNTSYNNFKPEIETKEKKMMMTNKDAGNPLPEILRFGSPEPILPPDFFTLPGTPPIHHHDHDCVGEGEADTDTDTVPWIDYPILDASDRCSDGELPSNLNPNPPLPPPLPPKPLDNQATVPVPVRKPGQNNASCSDKKPPHLHLQGGGLGVGLINFSHFLRPVALAKATLQSSAERLRSNEKASTSYNNSSPLQSMVIQSASASQHPAKPSWLKPFSCTHQNEVDASKHYCDDSNNKVPPPSPQPVQRIQLLEKEKQREKDKEKDKDKDKATDKEKEKEKGMPQVVAPTSVCSRNVGPKHKLKRKSLEEDTDNATNSDEDVQDESVGLTRSSSSRGTSTKRGRTAEVHNLSERRRRDRINEKMRALQELIPNCNKVDKASMLDEAIEYLKTLQLQVQMMMMMGTGMCIPPPMMVPPGLHHMPLAPYPQMGVGMGMGMSMGMGMGMRYGMGVGDINHPSVIHTMPTPPLPPPLNFMPMINGAVFPFDNGIPLASSFRPQDEKRHVNPSNLAQSGAIGANYTDTTNGETVKSDTSSWS